MRCGRWLAISVLAATAAVYSRPAEPAEIAGIDDAAHRALRVDARKQRDAIEWLLRNGDQNSVAVLVQLLRWLPDEDAAIVVRLQMLTGARPGPRWFDWMVWQQGHPEIKPYPGYAGFLADLLAGIDPRFRRFVRADMPHEIRLEEIVWGGRSEERRVGKECRSRWST